jgi:hypothetical protein
MKMTLRFLTAALLGLTLSTGWCQTRYTNLFSGINAPIPDGALTGWGDTRTVDIPVTGGINDLEVTLTIAGGFNGDLYGSLTHDSGFAVLLNRPGRTAANGAGYSDSGFTVTFGVGMLDDIHLYQGVTGPVSPLTGLWGADGRTVHPLSVLNTDSRTALVDSFLGLNPSGSWTLFLADVDGGGAPATLVDWGLILMVPEPATTGLMVLGLGFLILRRLKG